MLTRQSKKRSDLKTATQPFQHYTSSMKVVAVVAAATAGIYAPLPAVADSNSLVIDEAFYDGGKSRVNLSAELRSLTEEIASQSCRIDGDIDAANAKAGLEKSRSDFSVILDSLENGNTSAGIPGPESASRNIKSIWAVTEVWKTIDAASNELISDATQSGDSATRIENNREALYEETVNLAANISGHYSNPVELLASDAIALDILGRLRTQSNKMARTLCEIETGTGETPLEELRETVQLFDSSLAALRDGYPALGIAPPPTELAKGSLTQTYQNWSDNRSIFDRALSTGTTSAEDVVKAVDVTGKLNLGVSTGITLYLIGTPGQAGVYRLPLKFYSESELASWMTNPELIAAIKAQNLAHAHLSEDEIIVLDKKWRAERKAGGGPLISDLLGRPMSLWLREKQDRTAGLVAEAFVMDNRGLNVAQSAETSDYWQGDEAKWQETFGREDGGLHVGDIEFDESSGVLNQAQASLPIFDPETGKRIGAVTFGVNIQILM